MISGAPWLIGHQEETKALQARSWGPVCQGSWDPKRANRPPFEMPRTAQVVSVSRKQDYKKDAGSRNGEGDENGSPGAMPSALRQFIGGL